MLILTTKLQQINFADSLELLIIKNVFECLLLVTTIFIVKSVLKKSVSDW